MSVRILERWSYWITFVINNNSCHLLWDKFVCAVLFGNSAFIYHKTYLWSVKYPLLTIFGTIIFFQNRNRLFHCTLSGVILHNRLPARGLRKLPLFYGHPVSKTPHKKRHNENLNFLQWFNLMYQLCSGKSAKFCFIIMKWKLKFHD